MSYLNQSFFVQNRRALKGLVSNDSPIVIPADVFLQQYSDTAFKFRQNSNFWYLTGINEPSVLLVIARGGDYLILPNRTNFRKVEVGELDLKNLSQISGIDNLLNYDDGWRLLKDQLSKTKEVNVLASPPRFIKQLGFYANPTRSLLIEKLKARGGKLKINDITKYLVELRAVKQPEEISAIKAAIDITTTAFQDSLSNLSKFDNESEIDATIISTYRKAQSSPAFETIVASGKNACAIHYQTNNTDFKQSDLIVIDAGAEVEHYAADISRTYSLQPSSRQKDVHTAVLETQNYAYGILKSGVVLTDYESQVDDFMGKQLIKLGLIKSHDLNQIKYYFPHLTSHPLGLDTHDVILANRTLQPNMVITVEPGIYIPKEGIGVRLEDDVLITKGGVEVLSSGLSSQIK